MTCCEKPRALILVVEDIEETRAAIEQLLAHDGYKVVTAGNEEEAIFKARFQAPDLILMCLGCDDARHVAIAKAIRNGSQLPVGVPIVVFCTRMIDEGAEADAGNDVYMISPDNFDHLRDFLSRLLRKRPSV